MPPKKGGLKRPSNGTSSRAARLSSARNEAKQRGLPRAARPDPYDIPDSPGKHMPRLNRPDHGPTQFSPLRKQQKAPMAFMQAASAEETNAAPIDSSAADNARSAPQALELTRTPTSSRRSLRKQAVTKMMPAEESVGSAKRHASPLAVLSRDRGLADIRKSSPLFVPNDHMSDEVEEDDATIAVTQPSNRPAKRGRPRKNVEEKVPTKRRKVSGEQTSDMPDDDAAPQQPVDQPLATAESPGFTSTRSNAKSRPSVSSNSATKQGEQQVKPINARVSELFPQGQRDVYEVEVDSDDERHLEKSFPAAPAQRKTQVKRVQKLKQKKKKVPPASPARTTASKSTVRHEPRQRDNDEEPDLDTETDDSGLLGQYAMIKKLLRYAEAVRKVSDDEVVDGEIKKMHKFCMKFKAELNELQSRADGTMLLEDPPEELETIEADVHMLCGRYPSRPTDKKDQVRSQSIYFCMLPALVRVLLALIEYYRATDEHDAEEELSVTIPHLQTITGFMGTIIDLGEGAKLYKQPETNLAIVKPMRNYVLAPMKKIEARFTRHIRQHTEMQRQRAQNREEARRIEAAERAEQEAEEEKLKWAQVSRKWTQMHEERYAADELLKPLAKRWHLRQPSSEPEEDHNGHRFERLEVFRPRVGPPHALVEKAKSQCWPAKANQALMNGLQEWAGDVMIFERIFRRYCRRGGPLNAYNVTEIVVMAALMRHQFEQWEEDEGDGELAWATQIPDWTRPHTVLEQLEADAAAATAEVEDHEEG
ncbi:hypothetical protein Slin15195_G019440 [Septoria linicola]|uniref:Uncharacterized protein n=1 Tax=Septoria linicola TaxID=215465 RepID=A0A9Q9ALG4_9PEZI|nr:hypothetical protein Slin14017_G019500 [Septoria linicola]USW48625.1 hypothetical protein Slin15195_G019440 [Septoria linicola]